MPDITSQIPVGTQFTPKLIHLPSFLQALIVHSGNKPALIEAIWNSPVNIRKSITIPSSSRTQSLPLEAAIQYDLIDKCYQATDICRNLSILSEDHLYEEFARHILLSLGGLRVVEAAQQMKADSLRITGDRLAGYSAGGFIRHKAIAKAFCVSVRPTSAEIVSSPKPKSRSLTSSSTSQARLRPFGKRLASASHNRRLLIAVLCIETVKP